MREPSGCFWQSSVSRRWRIYGDRASSSGAVKNGRDMKEILYRTNEGTKEKTGNLEFELKKGAEPWTWRSDRRTINRL